MQNEPDERTAKADAPEPQMATDQPTPTQLMADAFKMMAHGNDPEGTPVTGPPVNVDVPHVTGQGAVGQELATTLGNWTQEPTQYKGAWFSDTTTHVGDGATYLILASDVGHSITCVVTASNGFGSTDAPHSNAVLVS